MTLKGSEIECTKRLAKNFEEGVNYINMNSGWESIGLTDENHHPILLILQEAGIVERLVINISGEMCGFTITPKAVFVAREIEESESKSQEPKDFVDEVKNMARKNRAIAIAIIAVTSIIFILTGANQSISLYKNIRDFSKTSQQP